MRLVWKLRLQAGKFHRKANPERQSPESLEPSFLGIGVTVARLTLDQVV
jgi:hypothetical protein